MHCEILRRHSHSVSEGTDNRQQTTLQMKRNASLKCHLKSPEIHLLMLFTWHYMWYGRYFASGGYIVPQCISIAIVFNLKGYGFKGLFTGHQVKWNCFGMGILNFRIRMWKSFTYINISKKIYFMMISR